MRLGCLLVHRRMSLVCILEGPGRHCGFVMCVLGASWGIVVCLVCASGWALGAFMGFVMCVLGGSWDNVVCLV